MDGGPVEEAEDFEVGFGLRRRDGKGGGVSRRKGKRGRTRKGGGMAGGAHKKRHQRTEHPPDLALLGLGAPGLHGRVGRVNAFWVEELAVGGFGEDGGVGDVELRRERKGV